MNTSLMATIGLDVRDFRAGLTSSQASLKELDAAVKGAAAQIASFEQAMKGGGTSEQIKQLDMMRDRHRELQSELKATTRQMAAFQAAADLAPAGPKPTDDSERYQEHLRRQDERERSARAHEAVENVRLPMPEASRPMAAIRQISGDQAEVGGGGGLSRNSRQQLIGAGHHAANSVLNGQNPLDALMVQAPDILEGLGTSIGAIIAPLAAVIAGGAFIKFLHDAKNEAEGLRKETTRIGSDLGGTLGADAGQLQKSLQEAAAHARKVQEARDSLKNGFVNFFTGGGVNDRDVSDARGKHQQVQDRLEDVQARDFDFQRRAFDGDGRVEEEKILVEFQRERAEIVRQTGSEELASASRALELAEKKRDLALEELAQRRKARDNELDEQAQTTGSRRLGNHVESNVAQDRLNRVRADMANGPHNEADWRRLKIQEAEAQTNLDDSKHREGEHDADLDLRKRNADLRGSSDDVAYQRARNSRDGIQAKLDDPTTKPDERRELEADLAEAKARLRDLATGSRQKALDAEGMGIREEQGRGPQERVASIEKELGLLERRKQLNRESNGDDPLVQAQLNSQAAALNKEKEDILFAEQQTLETARAHTQEMQLQMSGDGQLASIEATRLSYQQQITTAIRDGKNELAATLQVQGTIALNQQRMQAYFTTPGQQLAQRSSQHAQQVANELFQRDDGLQQLHKGMDGKPIDGYDPVLQRRRAFGDHSAYDGRNPEDAVSRAAGHSAQAIRKGAENAGKGDGANWKGENIVTAVKEVVTAVKGIGLKNAQ